MALKKIGVQKRKKKFMVGLSKIVKNKFGRLQSGFREEKIEKEKKGKVW